MGSKVVLTSHTLVSLTVPPGSSRLRVSIPSGEETWLMCSDTSQPRLLTLPSRMPLRPPSPPPRTPALPGSSEPTFFPVELLEPSPSCLSTPLTTPEPGSGVVKGVDKHEGEGSSSSTGKNVGSELPGSAGVLGGGEGGLNGILEGKVKSLGWEVSEHISQVFSRR